MAAGGCRLLSSMMSVLELVLMAEQHCEYTKNDFF
jgi:hypothetical protein